MNFKTNYMYRMGCTYPKSYCKAKICISTNPNCAKQKLSETIVALKEMYIVLKSENSVADTILSREKKVFNAKITRNYL